MRYVVKIVEDPSIDRIYYGVFTDQELGFVHHESEDQNLVLLLDTEEHANILCDILNEEEKNN